MALLVEAPRLLVKKMQFLHKLSVELLAFSFPYAVPNATWVGCSRKANRNSRLLLFVQCNNLALFIVQCSIYEVCAGHRNRQTYSNAAIRPEKESVMVKNFEEVQKLGQENADAATKAFGVISTGIQAIATEVADYSKKSLEESTKDFEQLLGTKSPET